MLEIEESLRDLYQEMIVDHGRHPRFQGALASATATKTGYNPLCGDHLVLQLQIDNKIIVKAAFEGQGCAISMASTSLMLERLQGMTINDAKVLFSEFHALILDKKSVCDCQQLGKLEVLAGVKEYPARIKCATLCWQTLHAILQGDDEDVCTE